MNGLLLWAAKTRNVEVISLWASVPFYIAQLPPLLADYPKAAKAVLNVLVKMLNLPIDLQELKLLADYKNKEIESYLQVNKIDDEELSRQLPKEKGQTLH